MDSALFDDLRQTLDAQGPAAAAERLCARLRDEADYANLFYALLLKKRLELGVSPVPTEPAQELPEAVHVPYEDAIRQAGRLVGRLYLEKGDIPHAWVYFRMIGEPEPVAQALAQYQFREGEDCQPVIEIAFHHGVEPRKGFDWILERYGICSAITTASGHEFAQAELREYCIKGLVRALYEQLRQRLADDVAQHDGISTDGLSIDQLIAGRDWLFEDQFAHVDVSHLSAVVQMSIALTPSKELDLARELCRYGARLPAQLRFAGEPPFEDLYRDYGLYLDAVAGERVDEAIEHFRDRAERADPETEGTLPAETLVNFLLRLGRPDEALAAARRYLAQPSFPLRSCPSLSELCRRANDYGALAEVARAQGDPVHFLAGLLASQKNGRAT
jgi:hypothetical protein